MPKADFRSWMEGCLSVVMSLGPPPPHRVSRWRGLRGEVS